MKVLVVHNAYQTRQIGGEDLVVEREVRGLKGALGPDNVFEMTVNNDDIRFLDLASKIWGNKDISQKIANLIVKHQIDIVHVHNFFPLLTPMVFAAAKKTKAKVIHTLHNFRWWCLSGILYRNEVGNCEKCVKSTLGLPAIYHRCYRNSVTMSLAGSLAFAWYRFKQYQENIDAYFVLTHFQQEKLKQFNVKQPMLLKSNPIDVPSSFVEPNEKKDYLFIGRLESAKGIQVLLQTWLKLPAHFCLNIIGQGDDDNLPQQYTRSNIRFLGQLPHREVLEKIAQAKYVIHSSLAYETFGLTLVEALAQGTPVIGFDKGTRSEFIQSGENGFLCQEENLSETLLQSYDYPDYSQLCHKAWMSAKVFYLPVIMEKQIALYNEVLST